MKKDILFTLPSYFRDDMNIMAYRFGKGEKTCAVVGALRGDEVQQLYVCARLVSFLREVEKEDGVQPGKSVMIVPTVIGASMNEGSRLWEPENMDINRRFPGVTVTRLAQGIPLGAEVKFMDRETLRQSLQYRQEIR